MAELINIDKGLASPAFNTYIPELEEPADIRDALKLLYYGTLDNGPTYEVTNSLYGNLINFNTRIDQNNSLFIGHDGAISDVHGVGSGSEVVGTIKSQTLTNKTLTSPVITGGTLNGGAALTVNSTELNYVDNVTSPIQTQINTNTPVGMISIHAGSSAPTGWLLCDGSSYSTTTYANLHSVVGYQFGGSGESFNVPNLKGRVVVGIDSAQASFDSRGETGGAMNHQHGASNSGVTGTGHNHTVSATTGIAVATGSHNHSVNSNHSHTIGHNHADNFAAGNSGNHGHSDNFSNAANNAYLKVSSGSSSLNVASGQHTHTQDGSVSSGGDHNHSIGGSVTGTANTTNSGGSNAINFNTVTGDTANTGGDHAHNVNSNAATINDGAGGNHAHTVPASTELSNLQPYIALNYIIKI
jgi:microcystin-dependent protein